MKLIKVQSQFNLEAKWIGCHGKVMYSKDNKSASWPNIMNKWEVMAK